MTMTTEINIDELDEFTLAYIAAALWSSNDEFDESGGDPLDKNYSIYDFDQKTLEQMAADCVKFQRENAALLESAYSQYMVTDGSSPQSY